MNTLNCELSSYSALLFDCDGVVLNSNKIKTQAFYNVAVRYGPEHAEALVKYHVSNGGISRYAKFEYFLQEIVKKKIDEAELALLLNLFSEEVKKGLLTCGVAERLDELRETTRGIPWLIVSGGDQHELREVFMLRGLDKYFDGGIFGSPDDKETILSREILKQGFAKPMLFLGDSKYDFEVASVFSLDFVFIRQWSEVRDLDSWLSHKQIDSLPSVSHLLNIEQVK